MIQWMVSVWRKYPRKGMRGFLLFGALWGGWTLGAANVDSRNQAEEAQLASERVIILKGEKLAGGKGVALRPEIPSLVEEPDSIENPDLVFRFTLPAAGRYEITTHSTLDAIGRELKEKATKVSESLVIKFQYGDLPPKRREVAQIWRRWEEYTSRLGLFAFPTAGPQELKVWLPKGIVLDWLSVTPRREPGVPRAAQNYQPTILPPKHPRLFVNPQSLPELRGRVKRGENLAVWEKLAAEAVKPCAITLPPGRGEIGGNTALEECVSRKAFYYLITGEKAIGEEAVRLIRPYLERVDFGNMLDVTRKVGLAIHTAALVYDWCYELTTADDREVLRENMLRLAETMECGWPPFKQSILNGHGNEAQICRDLLSMSIAVYDENPVPYRYCAYAVLENLVPMRRFEYQSPRHCQGVSYGSYRIGWDLHAKLLMERMAGQPVFDPNINKLGYFWLYMRTPSDVMLRDGDGMSWTRYWSSPQTMLLCSAMASSPVLKGELMRQNPGKVNPILYLLVNDPDLPAEPYMDSLPLTLDFGKVIGGMVSRTGWRMGANSNDAVVEIKGGGYHFGNHHHADAGEFQIYYRGQLVSPLGQYRFYGTAYDMNFAKRSGSRSMVLVVDPQEKFLNTEANDGGSRFIQQSPRDPEDLQNNPLFNYGKVVSCSYGPSSHRPSYSVFSANLAGAYSGKVKDLVRTLCFLNLGRETRPAVVLVHDKVVVSDPSFRKYWQVTTLMPPERTANGVLLTSYTRGQLKPTLPRPFAYQVKVQEPHGKLDVQMFLPKNAERTLEVFSGAEADSVFGKYYQSPLNTPETHAHRVMFSPRQPASAVEFFAVMQLYGEEERTPLPVEFQEQQEVLVAAITNRVVVLKRNVPLLTSGFEFTLPATQDEREILLYGLQEGKWIITPSGGLAIPVVVQSGRHTAFLTSKATCFRVARNE